MNSERMTPHAYCPVAIATAGTDGDLFVVCGFAGKSKVARVDFETTELLRQRDAQLHRRRTNLIPEQLAHLSYRIITHRERAPRVER